MKRKYLKELGRDLFFVGFGIAVALLLVKLGLLAKFLSSVEGMYILASFISGLFFTSIFTVAPASVALAALATKLPAVDVAFWGACGAMMVDYVIFVFVRDGVTRDMSVMFKKPLRKRITSLFHFGFMRWVVALLGAFIIASPLPDELGVALLSFSRIKVHHFVALTFAMNFLGILVLGIAARAIL